MANRKEAIRYLLLGLAFSIGIFMLFGSVTALIPNAFFKRMSQATLLDYIFLAITSLLTGAYISLSIYQKRHISRKCDIAAAGGGIGGFLGFGCAVCNKILVWLLGIGGVLTYVEPYRPFIGSVGIGLMSYAVYKKGNAIMQR